MKMLKLIKVLIVSILYLLTLQLKASPKDVDSTFAFNKVEKNIAKKSSVCDLFLTINSVTCDNKNTNIASDDEVIVIATITGSNDQTWELSRKVSHDFNEAVHLGEWVGDQTITLRINIASATVGYPPDYDRFELWYMIKDDFSCVGDVFVFTPECPCVKPNAGNDKKICLGSNTQLIATPNGGNWTALNGGAIDNSGNVTGLFSVKKYEFVYELNSCKDTVVVETAEPQYQVITLSPTCKEIGINNDGKIKLYNFAIGDKYQYSEGINFNVANAIPNLPTLIPNDGIIANNLANPISPKSYTIRITDGQGCSKDSTVVMESSKCCQKQICNPFLITKSR